MDNEKDIEEQKTTNDQEIIKDILGKRNKNPRKSWFGQDKEHKEFSKRFSQENIESPSNPIPEEELRNAHSEEKEPIEQKK